MRMERVAKVASSISSTTRVIPSRVASNSKRGCRAANAPTSVSGSTSARMEIRAASMGAGTSISSGAAASAFGRLGSGDRYRTTPPRIRASRSSPGEGPRRAHSGAPGQSRRTASMVSPHTLSASWDSATRSISLRSPHQRPSSSLSSRAMAAFALLMMSSFQLPLRRPREDTPGWLPPPQPSESPPMPPATIVVVLDLALWALWKPPGTAGCFSPRGCVIPPSITCPPEFL
mmetsp:Transcript_1890/g.6739  ORF Transcript_1890/g.6739 Transcript_1890/m.6739 type:complete len:232 (+) Transcript_1890:729-1424(+)